MTSDRWEHIFTVFDAALARPEAERAAFLSDHCGEDAHLREEVESLLAAHGDAEGFFSVDRLGPATFSNARDAAWGFRHRKYCRRWGDGRGLQGPRHATRSSRRDQGALA